LPNATNAQPLRQARDRARENRTDGTQFANPRPAAARDSTATTIDNPNTLENENE
jgi:hypothetical protein